MSGYIRTNNEINITVPVKKAFLTIETSELFSNIAIEELFYLLVREKS